ncbi:subtilisin-like proteinase Mp1 [Lasiosphaeris hirsuta]|uniref:Subtilisin-like proteinase Mp1 n=1 Tax=Lasiosphaeris hirsuta TaxID=260670 RepID=A0AA40AYG4_9PEZI|nr:subtilisin-like proteinase Mp1 [Lasiosphaeris hirsuta]
MVGFRQLALIAGIVAPWTLAHPVVDKRGSQVIPNKYIVSLKPGVSINDVKSHLAWARDVHARSSSVGRRDITGVEKVYSALDFNGYAGSFDTATIDEIRSNEQVAAVEPDVLWSLYDELTTQTGAPWGLGSISHRKPGSTNYIYNAEGGAGTYAYVLDTGVLTSHVELEGRATLGYNALAAKGIDDNDNSGHGTHTAGTIASRAYGVAKKANIVAVKVLDLGSEPLSYILDGYLWAVTDITQSGRTGASVISMSLGGWRSEIFNTAVQLAFGAGIPTVVAAGNEAQDAINISPASAPDAITVGAIDVANTRAPFSNYGPVVDIFAPGVDVLSSFPDGDAGNAVKSGTSMATPHVAGLVLYLKSQDTNARTTDAAAKLRYFGTPGVVLDGGPGSPNLLAYNGNGA